MVSLKKLYFQKYGNEEKMLVTVHESHGILIFGTKRKPSKINSSIYKKIDRFY